MNSKMEKELNWIMQTMTVAQLAHTFFNTLVKEGFRYDYALDLTKIFIAEIMPTIISRETSS